MLILSSLTNCIRFGPAGWRSGLRYLHTGRDTAITSYRVCLPRPHLRPLNVLEARRTVDLDFLRAEQRGFLREIEGSLPIIAGTEFSRGGRLNQTVTNGQMELETVYDANNPLEPELYQAMLEAAIQNIASRGLVNRCLYSSGANAIESVRKGVRYGENRGSITDGETTFEWVKKNKYPVDGWEEGITVESGEGVFIAEFPGPRDLTIVGATCGDMAELTFPIRGDLFFGPGAGSPRPNYGKLGDEFIFAETTNNPLLETINPLAVPAGVATLVEDIPLLVKLCRSIPERGIIADAAAAFLRRLNTDPANFEQMIGTRLKSAPYEIVGDAMFVGSRPIPAITEENILVLANGENGLAFPSSAEIGPRSTGAWDPESGPQAAEAEAAAEIGVMSAAEAEAEVSEICLEFAEAEAAAEAVNITTEST